MIRPYAAIVGAVNMDIWGRSFDTLIPRDSNPGEIRFSPGGVGRNIAHNLRLLDVDTEMLTALGGDVWAARLEEDCRALGIGLDRAVRVPDMRTSGYLYITGPDGELALAVCDTDVTGTITPAVIEQNLDLFSRAALVVFDGNLTRETMDCLTSRCRAPLFVDPVSVTKAKKLIPFLHRIHTIKPNALEAAALTGEADPAAAAQALVEAGVERVFVSDGPGGMFCAHGSDSCHVPCPPTALVDATGGGDAAMAGLCRAFLDGRGIVSAAHYALAAGSLAVERAETINPDLSDEAVRRRLLFLERKSSQKEL